MYARGDVVSSVDPFKLGEAAERYWLIVSDDGHPFAGEQYIAVAITTSPHDPALTITEEAWEDGGLPRTSSVSSWALHSPRVEDVTERVGRFSSEFCESVLAASREYLSRVEGSIGPPRPTVEGGRRGEGGLERGSVGWFNLAENAVVPRMERALFTTGEVGNDERTRHTTVTMQLRSDSRGQQQKIVLQG